MTWDIRNVGWPIPYQNDSWPISKPKKPAIEPIYMFAYRDQLYAQPYGYTRYISEYHKGRNIDTWV